MQFQGVGLAAEVDRETKCIGVGGLLADLRDGGYGNQLARAVFDLPAVLNDAPDRGRAGEVVLPRLLD